MQPALEVKGGALTAYSTLHVQDVVMDTRESNQMRVIVTGRSLSLQTPYQVCMLVYILYEVSRRLGVACS